MSKTTLALRTTQIFLTCLGMSESIALLYTMNLWMICISCGIGAACWLALFRIVHTLAARA